MKEKQHYYLGSTKVIFLHKESGNVSELHLNVMLRRDQNYVNAKGMGNIQTSAQMLFFQKMEVEQYDIIDVFIVSVSYLGHMTEAEFTEGMNETKVKASPKGATLPGLTDIHQTKGAFDA